MRHLALAALLSLPMAAAAYPNNSTYEPVRPYWQQPEYQQRQQLQHEINTLKQQRMNNCFNSGRTNISFEYGC